MKFKNRKRHSSKFRLTLRRNINRKNMKLNKTQQCIKIIDEKACEICGNKSQDQLILLCDQCDDAYHWPCIGLKEPPSLSQIWLCPNCKKLQLKKDKQTKIQMLDFCSKCQNKSQNNGKLKYTCEGQNFELMLQQVNFIQCLSCNKVYHSHCFSIRPNSLNCQSCETKIRLAVPKSHKQFLEFLKSQLATLKQKGYIELQKKQNSDETTKRAPLMDLKIFQQLTNWELITRHEASLYYAIKAKKLIFCDQQLYTSESQMELNDSSKQIIQVFPLHKNDQQIYQLFKSKIRRGAVSPLQIKQDRIKGFYIAALGFIEKGTIICQYAGEVYSHRASLNQQKNTINDSIFTLLLTGSSKGDLNIIPKHFGSVGRFICGVNNSDREHIRKVNIQAVRFSHCGRMRLIFVAKKNLKKGDVLYLNYNAGTYQQYPTAHFVH